MSLYCKLRLFLFVFHILFLTITSSSWGLDDELNLYRDYQEYSRNLGDRKEVLASDSTGEARPFNAIFKNLKNSYNLLLNKEPGKILSHGISCSLFEKINTTFSSFSALGFALKSFSPGSLFFPYVLAEERDVTSPKDLNGKVKQVEERLGNQKPASRVTILLGNTGSGKSTVYNYLQGVPLVAKIEDGELVIDRKSASMGERISDAIAFSPDDPEATAQAVLRARQDTIFQAENGKIVHGFESGTSYPSISKNGEYFDCPGFRDTRGPEQDIINAYSLHTIFSNAQEFRLALVVAEDEMFPRSSRGAAFLNLIKQVEELFPNNKADDITKGLHLIITRSNAKLGDEKNSNIIKEQIIRMRHRDRADKTLTPFQKGILDFLASAKNDHITFFNKPVSSGEQILGGKKLIKDETYINGISPNISVAPETKLYTNTLANELTNEISDFFISFHERLVHGATRQLIQSHTGSAQALRDSFKDMNSSLVRIDSKPQTFENDITHINNVLMNFDTETLLREFSSLVERRRFYMRINPEINLDWNIKGTLTQSSAYIQPFSKPHEIIRDLDDNRRLIFKGHLIGTSDIQQSLDHWGDISSLTVYGINSLLIDSNFRAPGTSVAFVSPFWSVIGEKTIQLQGRDGDPFLFPAQDGTDGKPGLPGQSGGNFYGIVDVLHNSHNLTINVCGGKGGKGQDGGNGINGADGKPGTKSELEQKIQSKLKAQQKAERGFVSWFFTSNEAQYISEKSGEPAEPGGSPGAGGVRGIKGHVGSLNFKNLKFDPLPPESLGVKTKACEEDCLEEDHLFNGKPGKPGIGGQHKDAFVGEHTYKEMNWTELGKRVVADGVIGASAGVAIVNSSGMTTAASWLGSIGGPIGTALGFTATNVIGGIGGAVVGVGTHLVGTGADRIWSGDGGFHRLSQEGTKAPDGVVPEQLNSQGLEQSNPSQVINYGEIHRNWKTFYTDISLKE